MDTIVIVGASAAGISAADTLRQRGFTGRITLLGSESHLPYDRPPLSKQLLSGLWEPGRLWLRSAQQLAELDLNLRLGTTATGLDPCRREIALAEGEPVAYDGLIIATGAAPRRLPGDDLAGVHHLRTLDDALALRRRMRPRSRMVVIGAGFIGAEAAAVARDIGHFDETCDLGVRHGDLSERKFVAVYGRDGRVVGAIGAGMPKQLREARRLIVEQAEFPAEART
ncbi:hypothetical protein E1295_10440 [Nonomuraea mesophila]|uniref:FAD/NAD(P)-binding domain-containing protein n=1 Tax=Nonomuraea mesophila TaxID=2530382 RepID=A0A4R5FT46_9ACTN|nr:hypothetical protein E1295_10440 [Nonomuraea mesophila]